MQKTLIGLRDADRGRRRARPTGRRGRAGPAGRVPARDGGAAVDPRRLQPRVRERRRHPRAHHGDRLGRRGRGAEPDRAAGRGGPAGGRVPLAAAQESKPSPARSSARSQRLRRPPSRVGPRQRPAGQLDAGVAQRLGRERHRPLAHHAQPGPLGVRARPAGRA